jgi:hypothetical protein
MKINVRLWIVIILFSIVIIVIKNCNFETTKKYTFDRTISKNILIKEILNKKVPQVNNMAKITNKLICNYQLAIYDSLNNLCNMTYYDSNSFKKWSEFNFYLPKSARISYCDSTTVFYLDKYTLFCYGRKEETTQEIKVLQYKIYNVVRFDSSASKLLFLGEHTINSGFQTGFYILDLNTKEVIASKIIAYNNNSKAAENFLIYSGKFSTHDPNTISYCCDKFSKIFFFNPLGEFDKELTTKDNSPKPKLVTNNEAIFYERGETYNTNNAVLKKDDNVLVFSSRTSAKNTMTIDTYSFKSNQYLYSTTVDYKNKKSVDVYAAIQSNDHLILFFDEGISLFKLL